MRKKGLSEIIVRAVMSLYHGSKTKVQVGCELSEEFLVQVDVGYIKDLCCRQGSGRGPFSVEAEAQKF